MKKLMYMYVIVNLQFMVPKSDIAYINIDICGYSYVILYIHQQMCAYRMEGRCETHLHMAFSINTTNSPCPQKMVHDSLQPNPSCNGDMNITMVLFLIILFHFSPMFLQQC